MLNGIFSLVSVVFLAEHTVHVKMNGLTDCVGCWSVIGGAFFLLGFLANSLFRDTGVFQVKNPKHSGHNLMKDCYPESADIIIFLWEVWAASSLC